jgi:hypothetical protein
VIRPAVDVRSHGHAQPPRELVRYELPEALIERHVLHEMGHPVLVGPFRG